MLVNGMDFIQKKTVVQEETAKNVGSGGLDVFSTPMMLAFMENTAFQLAEKELKDEETTVGISVNLKHMRANLVGDEIECEAILVKVEGKKLFFELKVTYNEELVGAGDHVRYVVDEKKFIESIKR